MKDIELIGKDFLGPRKYAQKKKDLRSNSPGNPQNLKPNRKGKPKGTRNRLTLLREAIVEEAEYNLLQNWEKIVATTIRLAENGDSTCLKILWDRVYPSKAERRDLDKFNITINVSGVEPKESGENAEIIDGEIVDSD